jgi:dTDP-4-dehydrorhamnose 3,5-epimerase
LCEGSISNGSPLCQDNACDQGARFFGSGGYQKELPTLGKWFGRVFTPEDRTQLYGAAGFARGFAVLSDYAEIEYMCSAVYNPPGESGILWNDPEIGIEWPLAGQPILSDKDRHAQPLCEWLKRPEAAAFSMDEAQVTQSGLGKS